MAISKKTFDAEKFNGKSLAIVRDELTVEQALQILINGKPFTITMRTPGNDFDLIRGLLLTEDICRDLNHIRFKVIEKDEDHGSTVMNVIIDPGFMHKNYYSKRNLLSVSSCGICGKEDISNMLDGTFPLEDSIKIKPETIPPLFRKMKEAQRTFHQTGGSHASAVFDLNGNLISVREDIGRHNAVDKVIGSLLAENKMKHAKILLVSGRISFEIVSKCFKAKIPILAAVSAPSSMAVEFADCVGISLFAFCRKESASCYSHFERIATAEHLLQ